MAVRDQGKHRIRIPDDTVDLIRSLHPDIKKKIKFTLKKIISDPGTGKSLKDDLKGLKSYKAGHFRIIYRVSSKNIIEIVAIGPRRIIYELTYRIIRNRKRGK